jgi:cell growth-regulating nucleolar protein
MPSFVCDGCQDVFKKPKIEAHLYRCPYATSISCVDCYQVWSDEGFRTHTQCVSEEQKTRGPYYKPPKAKQQTTRNSVKQATTHENQREAEERRAEPLTKAKKESKSTRKKKEKKKKKKKKRKRLEQADTGDMESDSGSPNSAKPTKKSRSEVRTSVDIAASVPAGLIQEALTGALDEVGSWCGGSGMCGCL